MEHIRGKLYAEDGSAVVIDSIDGYLGFWSRSNGMKSYFGYFELPTDSPNAIDQTSPYRLVLEDGRAGSIDAEVHPSRSPGKLLAEFRVTGKLAR